MRQGLESRAALHGLEPEALEVMFTHMPDGVLLTTAASEIIWANPAYCKLTGYTLDQLIGKTPHVLHSPATDPVAIRSLWDSLSSCGLYRGRVVNRRADGQTFHAHLSIVRLDSASPGGVRFLCVTRDVTADVELEQQLENLKRRAEDARDTIVAALASLAEKRDDCTGAHLERVERFCRCMADWLLAHHPETVPFWARNAELIARCSILHDIGKVGIPDAILNKPGRLDEREQELMRRHPVCGGEIIERLLELQPESVVLRIARDIVLCHHERYDGMGYPQGVSGDSIPMVAQLTMVADVLDALTTTRPYKRAYSFDAAAAWIRRQSGTALHPVAVEAFSCCCDELRAIHAQYVDEVACNDPIVPSSMSGGIRSTSRPPPPAPSEPTLGGGLRRTLQTAVDSGHSGEVVIRHGSLESRIYMDRGRIAWIHAPADSAPLPVTLVHQHGVPIGLVRSVIAECKQTGRPFGDVLLEHGVLDDVSLAEIIREHLASKLRALYSILTPSVALVPHSAVHSGQFSYRLSDLTP